MTKVRLVMKAGPSIKTPPDQLDREYVIHLNQAKHYLRKALEAEEAALEAERGGAPNVRLFYDRSMILFQKATIEQNAALLCSQQTSQIMQAMTIRMLMDPDDVEAPPPKGSAVQ